MTMGEQSRPAGSWASSDAIRKTMTATRGRDTAAELAVRSAVHRRGLRYRVDMAPLRGVRRRADMVFPAQRIAVFIDGCFWHGCPIHHRAPKTNAEYWDRKVATNRERDRDTDRRLVSEGWCVIRVWEHEDPSAVADIVEAAVASSRDRFRRDVGPAG